MRLHRCVFTLNLCYYVILHCKYPLALTHLEDLYSCFLTVPVILIYTVIKITAIFTSFSVMCLHIRTHECKHMALIIIFKQSD